MVAAGTFRADLYYRLNVLPIRLPALRERLADLEALAEALCDDIARRSGMPHKSLSADALDLLASQSWPGNIRELRNVLEQAALMTDDLQLTQAHFKSVGLHGDATGVADRQVIGGLTPMQAGDRALRQSVSAGIASASVMPTAGSNPLLGIKPLPQAIAELEVQAIRDALAATGGNKLAASRLLGISRATLYEKLPMLARADAAAS